MTNQTLTDRGAPLMRALRAAASAVASLALLIGVPWLLSFAQPTIWEIGRPWYLAWAGLIYIVATMVTLAWIAAVRLRFPGGRRSCRYRLP